VLVHWFSFETNSFLLYLGIFLNEKSGTEFLENSENLLLQFLEKIEAKLKGSLVPREFEARKEIDMCGFVLLGYLRYLSFSILFQFSLNSGPL